MLLLPPPLLPLLPVRFRGGRSLAMGFSAARRHWAPPGVDRKKDGLWNAE